LPYRAQEGFVNLGLARQSQIDTNEEHHSQIGKGDEEGRFGKVVASPNSQKLTERGISHFSSMLAALIIYFASLVTKVYPPWLSHESCIYTETTGRIGF